MQNQQSSNGHRGFPVLLAGLAVVLVVIGLAMASAMVFFSHGYGGPNNRFSDGWGMMGGRGMMGGGFAMLLMMPIGIIVLLVIGYVLYRAFSGGHWGHYGHGSSQDNAMEILRVRYAKGEISKEQFEQMKKDIVS